MTTLGVKRDHTVCAGYRISSEVHLETTTGLLVGQTRTRSTVVWQGFQSGVQALVLGSSDAVLAAGPLNAHDTGTDRVRHHDRTDVWVWHVPRNVSERATAIALVHTWNPAWLRNMRFTLGTVDAISDLLDDSKMADLTIGGEMTWPADGIPWATSPHGRIRSGADDNEMIVVPRPLRVGGAHAEARA